MVCFVEVDVVYAGRDYFTADASGGGVLTPTAVPSKDGFTCRLGDVCRWFVGLFHFQAPVVRVLEGPQ